MNWGQRMHVKVQYVFGGSGTRPPHYAPRATAAAAPAAAPAPTMLQHGVQYMLNELGVLVAVGVLPAPVAQFDGADEEDGGVPL